MLTNVYSVYDVTSETFGSPFLLLTDGLAMRSFYEAAINTQTEISKYPDEYVLYNIGQYDDDTGLMVPKEPKRLNTASHAIKVFQKETKES